MEEPKPKPKYLEALKNRRIQVLIIITIIVIFLAIFTTREPEVSVRWISVKDFDLSEGWIVFDVTVEVDNGNIIGATLNSLEADIYYEGEYIGHVRTNTKYEIGPLGKSTIHVDLRVDNLPSEITIFPEIRARGTANVSVFFLTFDQEIDKTVWG